MIKGQPSGEAFIQMDSEEAAYASAKEKHNKYMVLPGKNQKVRYIEVFQVRCYSFWHFQRRRCNCFLLINTHTYTHTLILTCCNRIIIFICTKLLAITV